MFAAGLMMCLALALLYECDYLAVDLLALLLLLGALMAFRHEEARA